MIRNDRELHHAEGQLKELAANLEELSRIPSDERRGEMPAVADAIRMQIEDLSNEIAEYEDLKAGRLLAFQSEDLDSLGELLVKARIARGLTQAELAEELDMTQQQIQRYERDGYQKISLWRLAEIADALGLGFSARARLRATDLQEPLGRTG